MNLTEIYRFRDQAALIRRMQEVSLRHEGKGLAVAPALVGSVEWWEMVTDGRLPEIEVTGRIRRVRWGSMGDWPEFELETADGRRTIWTREGDVTRYVEGLAVRLRYVEHPWKVAPGMPEGSATIVTSIEVEESPRRSDPHAPGPGGIGRRLLRDDELKGEP